MRILARGGDRRPSVAAIPCRETSGGKISYLLSEPERIALSRIASTARFSRGATIYREGDPAQAVYNISSGVVRTSRTSSSRMICSGSPRKVPMSTRQRR